MNIAAIRRLCEHPLHTKNDWLWLHVVNCFLGGGSDHMQKFGSLLSINPYNPFLSMWVTLTRQPRWAEQPLHPGQRITREQALPLDTISNVFLMFAEQDKGSLEPGKLADIIVLDRDYLTCLLNEVAEIEVRRAFVGGKQVYEAAAK